MSGISGKMIYTWEGKELSTLNESEKEDARKWLAEARIGNIQDYSEVVRLLQPKKKIDMALIELDSAIEGCDEKTRIAVRVAFRRIIWRYYGEE